MIGPNADNVEVLLGNYNGEPTAPVTPLAGMRRKLGARTKILYAQGSELADGLPADGDRAGVGALHHRWRRPPSGLQGEYFNTASFNGQVYRAPGKTAAAAVPNATPLFTRIDPQINFKWWDGAPRADMDDDNFGVRWTGFLAPKVTGKYQLGGVGMNAFEIYFNGKQLARGNNRTNGTTVTRPSIWRPASSTPYGWNFTK